jgi:hypothetical protein
LLAALALMNAQWALSRKATSMSSTPTPALVAELAPALARTKQSLKTKTENETALKVRKACHKQAFFIFFGSSDKFGKVFAIFAAFFEKKIFKQST